MQLCFNMWINSSHLFAKEPLSFLLLQHMRVLGSKELTPRGRRFRGPVPFGSALRKSQSWPADVDANSRLKERKLESHCGVGLLAT